MSPQRPTILGLAGAGPWGRNFIETIAGMTGARLGAVATTQADVGALVDRNCRIVSSWQELIAIDDIDALIIATPPQTHAAIASAAIGSGLSVLIEKPLTLNLSDARMILEEAERHNSIALVDHTYLFHPAYIELRQRLQKGDSGPGIIRSIGGNRGPFRPDTPPLWDYGAHDVAMCLDLTRALPTDIEAEIVEQRTIEGVAGAIIRASLEFEGVTRAELTFGNLMDRRERRFEVVDRRGDSLIFDDTAPEVLSERPSQRESTPITVAMGAAPLERTVAALMEAVQKGEPDVAGLRLGVNVVEVLTAIDAQV